MKASRLENVGEDHSFFLLLLASKKIQADGESRQVIVVRIVYDEAAVHTLLQLQAHRHGMKTINPFLDSGGFIPAQKQESDYMECILLEGSIPERKRQVE